MLALGIILVLIAGGVLAAALLGTSPDPVTFDLGVVDIEASPLGVFLAGAVTLLLLVIGVSLVRTGVRRANRRRQEKRELHRLSEKYETRETRDRDPERREAEHHEATLSDEPTTETRPGPDPDDGGRLEHRP